ncbi:MAG: hypothetical protein V3T05_02770, partial [Myxococcota bacterium]
MANCTSTPDLPLAQLSVTPVVGDTDTAFTLDASGSSAPNAGDSLRFQFDLEGDGVFDTPVQRDAVLSAAFYPRPGVFTPVVEVSVLQTGGLARATGPQVVVDVAAPNVLQVFPDTIPRRSTDQPPAALGFVGTGLNLATR